MWRCIYSLINLFIYCISHNQIFDPSHFSQFDTRVVLNISIILIIHVCLLFYYIAIPGSLFLNSMMTLPQDQTIIMINSSLDILNCSISSRRFLQSYDQSADINILESTITSTDYDTLWINTGSNSFTLNIETSSLATYNWNTHVIYLNGPGTYFVHIKDSLLFSYYGRAISLNSGSGNLSLFVNNSNLRCAYSSQTVYLQTSGYIFFSLLASSVTSGGDSVYIEYSPSGGSMNFTNSYLKYRVFVYSVALVILYCISDKIDIIHSNLHLLSPIQFRNKAEILLVFKWKSSFPRS